MEEYKIINEFISKVNSSKINTANSIKTLVTKDNLKNNLKIIDELFFEEKLKDINQDNYNKIIDYIKSIHKINSGTYNDFNIWSASKSSLKQINTEFIQRHDKLNKKVGFPDNGNGIYKSFLGEKNLISFIKDSFEKNKKTKKKEDLKFALNTILYGPPGTGKTFLINERIDSFSQMETETNEKQIVLDDKVNYWHLAPGAQGYLWPKLKKGNYLGYEWCENKHEDLRKMSPETKTIITSFAKIAKDDIICVISGKKVFGLAKVKHDYSPAECIGNDGYNFQTVKIEWIKQFDQPLLLNSKHVKSFASLKYGTRWKTLKEQLALHNIHIGLELVERKHKIIRQNFTFTTFHQSSSYEDFIEGIKPALEENENSEMLYSIQPGSFYDACDIAASISGYTSLQEAIETSKEERKEKFKDAKPFYYFIDEINRGNVSSIFGELITLIEDGKRLGQKNETLVELPYSKSTFGIPPNLYIIGTMNTADRSVEALDTALRRRFSFKEILPEPSLLKKNFEGVNLRSVLSTINSRIELLVDRDHTIGHSYFMDLNGLDDLVTAFKDKVVPLLQEYFYGDYGKIGLVLGNGFVEKSENSKKEFSSFKYENKSDFVTDTYSLKKITKDNIKQAIHALLETDKKKAEKIE